MHTLYTYGYQGGGVQPIQRIAASGIVIVDIRYSPTSPYPGYRKASLQALLGDRYVHLSALGNVNYNADGPVQLRDAVNGIPKLLALLDQCPVCLLCGCAAVLTCHRAIVATMAREDRPGLGVCHLDREEIARRWPEEAGNALADG